MFSHTHQIQDCHLQTLSVWKNLKFDVWERVTISQKETHMLEPCSGKRGFNAFPWFSGKSAHIEVSLKGILYNDLLNSKVELSCDTQKFELNWTIARNFDPCQFLGWNSLIHVLFADLYIILNIPFTENSSINSDLCFSGVYLLR